MEAASASKAAQLIFIGIASSPDKAPAPRNFVVKSVEFAICDKLSYNKSKLI